MQTGNVQARLRARGSSMTAQRRAILHFLDGNVDHPTAAEIFEAVTREHPVTSRATVYNTLALLEEVGAVRVLREAGLEARFDPNTSPHHHLHCQRCGRIEDVPADAVEVRVNGAVVSGHVRIDGRCAAC